MIAEQLKRSVLQAAIQGKLTEQLPEDGHANDLLEEIQKEKVRLFKEGKIKRAEPILEITEDEKPFDIPDNWCWVRLENLSEPCDYPFSDGPFGSNLKSEHYTNNREVRIIQLSNIGEDGWREKNARYTTFDHLKTIARSEVKSGDIVIAKMMPAGRAIEVPMLEKKYVLSSDAIKFVPNKLVDKLFILYAINSDCFRSQIYEEVHGITRVRTSLSKVKTYPIPLPPLAEQKRIVKLLGEFFPKIDKLETDESKLDVLQKDFPKKMKDSLLQYAVEGKLTEQLPSDGDARDLLREIQREKARLVKERKIKKEKMLPEITEDELPFEIPENWCWVRLGEIIDLKSGQDMPSNKFSNLISGIPYITGASNFLNGALAIDRWTNTPKSIANKGDLLITCKGTVGEMAFLREEKAHIARQVMAIKVIGALNSKFVNIFLNWYVSELKSMAKSMIPGISREMVLHSVMPLPPLEEQQRIVQRLEELLPEVAKLQTNEI